jgi:hypothetical protein
VETIFFLGPMEQKQRRQTWSGGAAQLIHNSSEGLKSATGYTRQASG